MSEDIVDKVPEVVEEKKPRGNPAWVKKDKPAVKRAEVVSENIVMDEWYVGNKDPRMKYSWGRKSSDEEMNMFAQKGYVPAQGSETIVLNPFASNKNDSGKTKERGDRILMCCPKTIVDEREKARLSRYVNTKKQSADDARKLSGQSGIIVEARPEDNTEVTIRESIKE